MNKTRRNSLLVTMAATVPSVWKRPVIEAVVLPAHALTSPETELPGCPMQFGIPSIRVGCEGADFNDAVYYFFETSDPDSCDILRSVPVPPDLDPSRYFLLPRHGSGPLFQSL